MKSLTSLLLSFFILSFLLALKPADSISWKQLDDGLFYSEFNAPQKSGFGDNKINVLKIDPAHFNFNLFSAKEKGEKIRTAPEWALDKKQIAIINTGMYQADYATNVGFMKDFGFVNNPRFNQDNTIVAFNRKEESVPEIQIIDRTCQDWEKVLSKYNSGSQGIRMIDCNQKNKWGQQARIWSMVVIGMDKNGNALFIFSRSPFSVHDFINILLNSSLDLNNAMYLEGGPEASFYVNHADLKVAKMGSYETGFNENDGNNHFWQIPNVIGISKK